MRRKKEVRERLQEAEKTLRSLETPDHGYPGHGIEYFENVWNTQKARQLDVMTEELSRKKDTISVLLGLEESLIAAR